MHIPVLLYSFWFIGLIQMSFSVVSLNTRGCRDSAKRFRIIESLKNEQAADIVFLQDIHTLPSDEAVWNLIWRGEIEFSHLNSNTAGLAIAFSNKLDVKVECKTIVLPGRILHLTVEIGGHRFYLINVYCPTDYADKATFHVALKTHLNHLDASVPILLGGDFNCTLNPQLDRTGVNEPHPFPAKTLDSILSRFKLTDVYRSIHPNEPGYTWSRSDGTAARLDRFYISKDHRQFAKSAIVSACNDSDHSLVRIYVNIKSHKRGSAYWCLNTSLLEDNDYIDLIKSFWTEWGAEKRRFSNLQTWWDCGKKRIKEISILFSTNKNSSFKQKVDDLKAEIDFLESNSNDPDLNAILSEKRAVLAELQHVKVRGAWIRSRFSYINESDRPTSYFFNLEKRRGTKKILSHLRLPNGLIVDDDNEIRNHARVFYQDLYSPDPVDIESQEVLLDNLPQLSAESKSFLDEPLTLEELSTAVKLVNKNKSPGIDGLPSEFYQTFWPILGQDFYDVFLTSVQENELPLSCRRAVLTLLPKKGDTSLLQNWRPVSLLCCDYKIFTRSLSNRLRTCLTEIIHLDQSYCVPGRHIADNIRLISDVVEYANECDIPLGIISLDQRKAFDRVHHEYLTNTLKAFGFGDYFLQCINTLYTDVTSLLKINNKLTSPFAFKRGIRQGCSLSGQLYAICLEPLLHKLRSPEGISGVSLPMSGGKRCKQSAYADDVDVLATQDSDFTTLSYWIGLYQHASNAEVNYTKSEGLWCGSWRNRTDTPLGLKWNSEGMKILGTYTGNTKQFLEKNWDGLATSVSDRLDRWKPFAKALSFRGRVLVANLLAASKLWHKFNAVSPPNEVLDLVQRILLDFVWQGKHWVAKEVMFLPLHMGGQGIVHLVSRLRDFRFQFVYRLIQSVEQEEIHPSVFFSRYFLSRVGKLGYGNQLFLLENIPVCNSLPTYYRDCLRAWNAFSVVRHDSPTSVADVLDEPLFKSKAVRHPLTGEPLFLENFVVAGVTQIQHLIDVNGRRRLTVEDLQGLFPWRCSKRFLQRMLDLVWAAIPKSYLDIL
jgi:exonuclease III